MYKGHIPCLTTYLEGFNLNRKKLEIIFKNLKEINSQIKEMEFEIEELEDLQQFGGSGASYVKIIKNSNLFSKTENHMLKNLEIKETIKTLELEKRILERVIKRIYNALNSLTELEKQIVTRKYIDEKIWRIIVCEVNIEERQCRDIKNRALDKMISVLNVSRRSTKKKIG
ncbi:sigma-70 RNA polymerase sigma factor region 4 domain-containing protein [Marinisporobacter balticus]|uniref:RinA family phage transcriptional activator n=1 Tax=Marinisporobacter balticus TaxID=2018667 RepID=A0A4R2KV89_9FIRM|nr:sigma-70 family RNA polymerase sigma factor [Marinisporobacter balticus]TCO70635.1 hypothetical protein EV214_1255 [Marinisporobacter balticus]